MIWCIKTYMIMMMAIIAKMNVCSVINNNEQIVLFLFSDMA